MNMAVRTHNVDQKSREEAIAEIARPQYDHPLSLEKTGPKARASGHDANRHEGPSVRPSLRRTPISSLRTQ